jgi:hypothetical protein
MILRFISPLLILALVAGRQAATAQASSATSTGGACRDALPAEKAILDKAWAILSAQIAKPLRQAGWVVEEEVTRVATIAKSPGPYRPMMLCAPYFGYTLKLDPNSELGKQMQDSALYYSQQMNDEKDMTRLKAAMAGLNRIQRSSEVSIRVYDNSPYLKEPKHLIAADRFATRNLPGAGYCWQLMRVPRDEMGNVEEETDVYVGNWTGADMHAASYSPYPFVHKQAGPWLETLRFIIAAPRPVADAIIGKVDWAAVAGALTK